MGVEANEGGVDTEVEVFGVDVVNVVNIEEEEVELLDD